MREGQPVELREKRHGGTPSRTNQSLWNGGIPWLTPTGVSALRDKYVRETAETISKEGLAGSAARLLPVGSIMVTTRATIGEAAIAGVPLATNQGFKNIIPNESTDSVFAYYAIQTLKRQMLCLASGTTFLEISKADFSRIRARRPKRNEQKRIAAVLDTVDDSIAATDATIEKLRQVRRGIMDDLFTRGITPDGRLRPTRETAPQLYKESPFGWIPKEWSADSLENVTSRIVDGVHRTPTYVDRGIPFVTVKNLTLSRSIDFTDLNHITLSDHREFLLRADPKPGDVLVTKDGTLGISRIVEPYHPEFSIFVSVALLRPNPKRIRAWMLHLFFDSGAYVRQLGRLSAGTGLKHIHLEHFRKFVVPLPDLEEQDRVACVARSLEEALGCENNRHSRLLHIKRGMMNDLLSGGRHVPEGIGVTP